MTKWLAALIGGVVIGAAVGLMGMRSFNAYGMGIVVGTAISVALGATLVLRVLYAIFGANYGPRAPSKPIEWRLGDGEVSTGAQD